MLCTFSELNAFCNLCSSVVSLSATYFWQIVVMIMAEKVSQVKCLFATKNENYTSCSNASFQAIQGYSGANQG